MPLPPSAVPPQLLSSPAGNTGGGPRRVVVTARRAPAARHGRFDVRVAGDMEDGRCRWVRGMCPVDDLPAGRSTAFEVGGETFELATSVAKQELHLQILCSTASPTRHVYIQSRVGVVGFNGESHARKTLHCLFDRAPPFARQPKPVVAMAALDDESLRYTAARCVGLECDVRRVVLVDVVLRVLQRTSSGTYHVAPLPAVPEPLRSAPSPTELEGGRWVYDLHRCGDVGEGGGADKKQVEKEGAPEAAPPPKGVQVTVPEWAYHNVLWSKGIDMGAPHGRVWRFQVKVDHPGDEAFNLLRVGVVPRTAFAPLGTRVLDYAAAINQEGVCVIGGRVRQRPPVDPDTLLRCTPIPNGANTATVEVYVDTAAQTVAFVVGDAVYNPMKLGGPVAAILPPSDGSRGVGALGGYAGGGTSSGAGHVGNTGAAVTLHPFAVLQYLGDAAVFVGGGAVDDDDGAGGDTPVARAVRERIAAVFTYYDVDSNGVLSSGDVDALRRRSRNVFLSSLRPGRVHPRYVTLADLHAFYAEHGDQLQDDFESTLPRRVDPTTGRHAPRHAFAHPEADWHDAAEEVAPARVPQRLPDGDGGQTRDEHREGGGTLEEWLELLADKDRRVVPGGEVFG